MSGELLARTPSMARVAIAIALCAVAVLPTGAGHAASPTRPAPEPATPWVWPVPGPIRIVEPYRAPATRYTEGHRGIDLAVEPGADVVAAESGTVRYAGWVGDRYLVSIDHGNGVVSSVEPVAPSVAEGDVVSRGGPIGRVSPGGHCAGACAHFGVRVDGDYVSPLWFFGGVPRAVLLPDGG